MLGDTRDGSEPEGTGTGRTPPPTSSNAQKQKDATSAQPPSYSIPLWAKRSGYRGTDKATVSSFSSETGRPKIALASETASKDHYPHHTLDTSAVRHARMGKGMERQHILPEKQAKPVALRVKGHTSLAPVSTTTIEIGTQQQHKS